MKRIPVVDSDSNIHYALIDDEDEDLVSSRSWYLRNGYAYNNISYRVDGKRKFKATSMHRIIFDQDIIKGKVVDHINGNSLDNRRSNLRIVSNSCNHANTRLPRSNTSGFKGVSLVKRSGKYIAKVVKDQKDIHVGTFSDPVEAAKAYDKKATEVFGEFARTNKSMGLY